MKDYEWGEQIHLPSTISKEHISELRFFEGKQNLLLLESPGTGKTHLATALCLKACEQGYQVKFFNRHIRRSFKIRESNLYKKTN